MSIFTEGIHSHLVTAANITLGNSAVDESQQSFVLNQMKTKIGNEIDWHISDSERTQGHPRPYAAAQLRTMLSFLHKAAHQLAGLELARQVDSGLDHLFSDSTQWSERIKVTEFTKSQFKDLNIQIPNMDFGRLIVRITNKQPEPKIDQILWFDSISSNCDEIDLNQPMINSTIKSKISELNKLPVNTVNPD